MTETKNNLGSLILRKCLRGVAVIIMLTVYGAGMIGITGLASVASSTEAAAWHRGRGHYRGRGRGYGRRGYGRRGWWGRRGRGRRGRGLYFYFR